MFFPLGIHSGKSASCKPLFISITNLSWMEVNFLNQNPRMPSRPENFPIWYFWMLFSVEQSFFCFAFSLLSTPNSFPIWLFCYNLFVAIFKSENILFPCHSVVGGASCNFSLLAGRIVFDAFGMSYFVCIVLPCLDIFLIFLLWQVSSGYFFELFSLFYLCYFFLFVPICSSVFQLFYYYRML